MDGLIVLLVILGLISSVSKKKKAQHQKQQRARQAGYDEISAVPPPLMREGAPEAKAAPAAKQAKVPYTKEEWAKVLSEIEEVVPKKPVKTKAAQEKTASKAEPVKAEAAGSMQHKPTEGLHIDAAPAQRLRPAIQHLEGESHKEHAAHKQRIAEEEARLHREREELKELRNLNLKKLRSAVVMSEVLGKPVALRPRGR